MNTQTKVIVLGIVIFVVLSGTIITTLLDDVEGPLIYQIDIMPSNPVAGDYISLAVYCIDRSGIASATLWYSINGEEWNSKEMTFLACLCIAGGRWTAGFGPLSNGDTAKFYVTVFDDSPARNVADSQMFEIQIEG